MKYLNKNTIKLNVDCKNWEHAVKEAGKILYKNGSIEKSYIDGMVKYIKKYGPYVVLIPGFALAHARPEDGAKEVGMSLITLKEPVDFGHKDNDPVKVVIGFCATKSDGHIQALADLCGMFNQENVLDKIYNAKSVDEVLEVFRRNTSKSDAETA